MKKVLTALFTLCLFGMAFAQQPGSSSSKTSTSTQGLFKTDVDNYYDLAGWDSVKPENFFGFLGYDTSADGINFGLAHQFKNLFVGYYFGGALDEYTVTSSKTTAGGSTTSVKSKETSALATAPCGTFDTGLLFGFGNMAIKAAIYYDVTRDEISEQTNPDVINNNQKYVITPEVDFAMKSKLKDWDAVYSGNLAFEFNVDETYSEVGGVKNFTDNSKYILYLGAGMGLEKSDKKFTHNIAASMLNKIYIFSSDISATSDKVTSQEGKAGYELYLTPSYELTYPASKNLTFKFGVTMPLNLAYASGADSFETDGTKSYPATVVSDFDLYSQTNLRAALVYQWKPNFALNTGIGINAPKFALNNKTTVVKNTTSGDVESETSALSFTISQTDASCSWSSGFTFTPAKGIVIDASYEILANIFGSDFKTDFNEGSGTSILNNLNKAIVHNIAVEVSVKL